MGALNFVTKITGNADRELEKLQRAFSDLEKTAKKHDFTKDFEKRFRELAAKLQTDLDNIRKSITGTDAALAELKRKKEAAAAAGDTKEEKRLQEQIDLLQKKSNTYKSTLKRLEEFKDKMNALGKAYDEANKNSEKASGGNKKLLTVIKNIAGGGLKALKTGILAITSIGIVGLISAITAGLTALVRHLKKSEEGTKFLAKVTGTFKGLVAALKPAIDKLGKSLFDAFTKAAPVLEALTTRAVALFSAVSHIIQALAAAVTGQWKEAAAEVKQMGADMLTVVTGKTSDVNKDAIEGNKELAESYRQLEERERQHKKNLEELGHEEVKYNNEIAKAQAAGKSGEVKRLNDEIAAKRKAALQETADIAAERARLNGETNTDEMKAAQDALLEFETEQIEARTKGAQAAENLAEKRRELEEKNAEMLKEQGELKADLVREASALEIEAMEDGFAKEQAELNHEREERKNAIDREYDDRAKEIEKQRKAEYKLAHNGSSKGFSMSVDDPLLIQNEQNHQKAQENADKEFGIKQVRLDKQIYDSRLANKVAYLEAYGNLEEKELAITEKYDALITEAKKNNDPYEIKRLEKERDEAYADLKDKTLYKKLAKDRSEWLIGDTVALLQEAEKELENLGNQGDKDDATLERIQRLRKEVDGLKADLSSAFTPEGIFKQLFAPDKEGEGKSFADRIRSLRDAWRQMTAEQKWKSVGGYVTKIGSGLSKAAESMREIAELTGDDGLAETADQLSAVAQNFSAAGQGAASGGWIGAIVGGLTDMIGQTIEAFQGVKVQEKLAEKSIQDWADAIEMASLTIDESSFSTIFGKKGISLAQANMRKATDSIEMYYRKLAELDQQYSKQNIKKTETTSKGLGVFINPLLFGSKNFTNQFKTYQEAIQKGYTGLQRMLVKTKDYSGWANFWGKQDQYASLGDIAPELWEGGEFNVDNAKRFLEVNKQINDEQRKQIQNLIDLKESYDDALKAVDEAAAEYLGDFASSLTDVIWDSVMTGADAWEGFAEAGSEAITAIGKSLIQEMLISEYLEQFRDRVRDAYTADNIETTQSQLRGIVSDIFNGMDEMLAAGSAVAEEYKSWATGQGFDLTGKVEEAQNATAGAFQTMSQDTATELNGRFTALQLAGESIRENAEIGIGLLTSINTLSADNNIMLAEIRNFHQIEAGYLEDISRHTKPILGFGEKLDKIVTNTDRL